MVTNTPEFSFVSSILIITLMVDVFAYLLWIARKLHIHHIFTNEYEDKLSIIFLVGSILTVIKHIFGILRPNSLVEFIIQCSSDFTFGYGIFIFGMMMYKKIKDKQKDEQS